MTQWRERDSVDLWILYSLCTPSLDHGYPILFSVKIVKQNTAIYHRTICHNVSYNVITHLTKTCCHLPTYITPTRHISYTVIKGIYTTHNCQFFLKLPKTKSNNLSTSVYTWQSTWEVQHCMSPTALYN